MANFRYFTNKTANLKILFIVLIVFFTGLYMGSHNPISRLQQTSAPALVTLKQQALDTTVVSLTPEKSNAGFQKRTHFSKNTSVLRMQPGSDIHGYKGNSSILCPFPDIDPFDPKIIQFVKKYPTLTCQNSFIPSVVSVVGDELKIDPVKLKAKLKLSVIDGCKYRTLSMLAGNDFKVVYGSWSERFNSSIRLQNSDENLVVDCHHNGKLVSRSYLPLIRRKNETETKRVEDYQKHIKKTSPKETLSVIMIGVDGTSKQNYIRSMPKTREFLLKQLGAIECEKYNKLGLNTFPNVVPLLAGLSEEELKWDRKQTFDSFDHLFLWNQYQKAGYRTAMLMDMVEIAAFHYLKKGWAHPTFDFYPRPITVVSEPDRSVYRKGNDNCMGDTPEVTLLHDYWLQLATVYNNSRSTPYFGYSFMARLTHDDQNKASSGDELYLRFFQELMNRNVLNNTLLIFFSDHGERYGTIRNTYAGIIENKTPFFVFMFPPWFEKKYRKLMDKFRFNAKNRLMTHYDVHATLQDILYFTGESRNSSPLDRNISLFSEIPSNRTCKSAGIPVKYCACNSLAPATDLSEDVQTALAMKLLEHVISRTKNYRNKCTVLSLKETKSILSITPEVPLEDKKLSFYYVTIQTSPGDAIYEATLSYKFDTKVAGVTGDVSRLNMYRGQAECIFDSKLRSFCFCKK